MFQHWSMKTRVISGIFGGVLVLVIGLGTWAVMSGKIESFASGGTPTGSTTPVTVINGKVSKSSNCGAPLTKASVALKILSFFGVAQSVPNASGGAVDQYGKWKISVKGGMNADSDYILRGRASCEAAIGSLGTCKSDDYTVLPIISGSVTLPDPIVLYGESGRVNLKIMQKTATGDQPVGGAHVVCKNIYQDASRQIDDYADSNGNFNVGVLNLSGYTTSPTCDIDRTGFKSLTGVSVKPSKGCQMNNIKTYMTKD